MSFLPLHSSICAYLTASRSPSYRDKESTTCRRQAARGLQIASWWIQVTLPHGSTTTRAVLVTHQHLSVRSSSSPPSSLPSRPRLTMPSPLLPWELIERVIGHSGGHRETLRRFSLTCHNLRPRALCLLVADVHFKSRDQIFDFCDFLQANPHLKTLVCSITVKPGDFAPFPLLSVLPNLSKLKFYPPPNTRQRDRKAATVLNRSTVACCRSLGTNIQTLHLSQLSFPTCLDFARLLLMFANLTHLCCSGVFLRAEKNQTHVDVVKRRISDRLHLSTVSFAAAVNAGISAEVQNSIFQA